jgi:nucleotide-binding universal stress UspA family protein
MNPSYHLLFGVITVVAVIGLSGCTQMEKATMSEGSQSLTLESDDEDGSQAALRRTRRLLSGCRTADLPCLLAHTTVQFPLRRVLIATDFSASAKRALDLLTDWLAGPLDPGDNGLPTVLELLCVSVRAEPKQPPRDLPALLEAERERADAALGSGSNVEVRYRVRSAAFAVDGIEQVAAETGADLIVLGTHGYGRAVRFLLGSVAFSVVRTVSAPILLVPLAQAVSPQE